MSLRILILAGCLAHAAAAQCSPARYSTFGQGCPGTGFTTAMCLEANWALGNFNAVGQPVDYAILSSTGPQLAVVCSISFFVGPRSSGNVNVNVSIYDRPTAGAPPGNPIATTTMLLQSSLALHTAEFVPPVALPAATEFFIVIDNRVGLALPFANGGLPVTHYYGSPQAWNGPASNTWKYQINCCVGGATPLLLNQGTPRLGAAFGTTVSRAVPNGLALRFTGYSDTSWNGVPLPLDLTPAGAPGCFLRAPALLIDATTVNGTGTGSLPLLVPNVPVLCGARFFQQWAVLDVRANALGFAFSNGGAGTIGS